MVLSDSDIDNRPRSLRDAAVQQRRKAMLNEPHVARLTDFAAKLRAMGRGKVPDFDPLDGGEDALALFLLEKPGRMTERSCFISRNNNDQTAENICKFMGEAGIPRKQTVIWNVVPWWNCTRKVTEQELRDGADCVKELITILQSLRVVVMVGRRAAKARRILESMVLEKMELFTSDHPSPVVRATNRKRWEAIPSEWKKVIPYLGIST
jgi:uracil-DNA glycosylase